MNSNTILILLSYIILRVQCQTVCSPKTGLNNLIQDQITLVIQESQRNISKNFVINLNSTSFNQSIRQFGFSIINYDTGGPSILNYILFGNLNDSNTLVLRFDSNGMRWNSLKVHFWVSARLDMLIGVLTNGIGQNYLVELIKNEQKLLSVGLQRPLALSDQPNTISVHFIIGLSFKNTSQIFEVQIGQGSTNLTHYNISIIVGNRSQLQAISFTYVIFNLLNIQFAITSGITTFFSFTQTYYFKSHRQFAPVRYFLFGFNKLRLSLNSSLALSFSIDQDYIIEVKTINSIQLLQFVYLNIGVKTVNVCPPCGQFVYSLSQCVTTCPNNTYIYSKYSTGGKSCQTCSLKVQQTLNQLKTGCDCITGYKPNLSGQCVPIQCTDINSILVGNQCVCKDKFFNSSGICISCGLTEIFNGRECVKNNCSNVNEIINNNSVCICNNLSVRVNGICSLCPSGSYKQVSVQVCRNCLNRCINCQNNKSCIKCSQGFNYNIENLLCLQICGDGKRFDDECDDGNKIDNDGCSSKCKVQNGYECAGGNATSPDKCSKIQLKVSIIPGFPVLTPLGIVIDFRVLPNNTRTFEELNSIIKVTVSDQRIIPFRIVMTQNKSDKSRIRCLMWYLNQLPIISFTTIFQFKENPYGTATLQYKFDGSTQIYSILTDKNKIFK